MKLNSNDYRAIAEKISEGSNYVEYVKNEETIAIECNFEVEGYIEDDYYNGTGAFDETSRKLYVVSVESWSKDGDDTDNDFDENELISWVA